MDFDKVVEKRQSIRKFKNKTPNWRDIVKAIDIARQIPLAGNVNTLKFLLVMDKDKIEKIAEAVDQQCVFDTNMLIVVCSDESQLEKRFDERGRIYTRQQAGAAIQTLLLKLTDMKLASCWVGAFDDNQIRKTLSIPKKILIEAVIPIGYEKEKCSKKRKMAVENLIYCDKWDQKRLSPENSDPKRF